MRARRYVSEALGKLLARAETMRQGYYTAEEADRLTVQMVRLELGRRMKEMDAKTKRSRA